MVAHARVDEVVDALEVASVELGEVGLALGTNAFEELLVALLREWRTRPPSPAPAWLSPLRGRMGIDFGNFYNIFSFVSFFSFRICFDTLPETASRLLGECLRNIRAGHHDSLLAPSTTARV
jgi:hypothetical protein